MIITGEAGDRVGDSTVRSAIAVITVVIEKTAAALAGGAHVVTSAIPRKLRTHDLQESLAVVGPLQQIPALIGTGEARLFKVRRQQIILLQF